MSTYRIVFYEINQKSQLIGSTSEHTVARLYFKSYYEGKEELHHCDIIQPDGSDNSFESEDPLEVHLSDRFKKRVMYDQFRDAAEQYYRSRVGSKGSSFNVSGTNIQMSNNKVLGDHYVVEVDSSGLDNEKLEGAW